MLYGKSVCSMGLKITKFLLQPFCPKSIILTPRSKIFSIRHNCFKMFITVRFGDDSREIFNPDSRIVNLMNEIRKKCKVEDQQIVDLTDETGLLVRISMAKPQEKGLKYLSSLTTYVLVEKRTINAHPQQKLKKDATSKDLYFPLLVNVNKLLPDYHFHKTMAERAAWLRKTKAARNASQSDEQKDEGKSNYQRKSVSLSSTRKSIASYRNTSRRFTTALSRRSTMM